MLYVKYQKYVVANTIQSFITSLQTSKLFAECPHCGEEFSLSKALLFDGRKKFPDKAGQIRLQWEQELKDRISDLAERQKQAKTRSEKAAVAIGIGKIVEKILPAHKNFKMTPADCRFLAEPIDMIVFDGLASNKIKQITFMDIKTGKATLNTHQKRIRDAINDHNVEWRTL